MKSYYSELLIKTETKQNIRDKRDYTTLIQNNIAIYK